MTTDTGPALHLRCALAAIYLRDAAPPGEARAAWLIAALRRTPHDPAVISMARDLLAAVSLYRRLHARAVAEPDAAATTVPLLAHAAAELQGSTAHPGWRAAALDLLEPDEHVAAPLDPLTRARLLVLGLGLCEGKSPDGSDGAG